MPAALFFPAVPFAVPLVLRAVAVRGDWLARGTRGSLGLREGRRWRRWGPTQLRWHLRCCCVRCGFRSRREDHGMSEHKAYRA